MKKLSAESILLLKPGDKTDRLIANMLNLDDAPYSRDMNATWTLRNSFLNMYGGEMILQRFCDSYPEACFYQSDNNELNKVSAWAKSTPLSIVQTILLYKNGYTGDFHPWNVFGMPRMFKLQYGKFMFVSSKLINSTKVKCRILKESIPITHERRCRVCGCTEYNACPGGCWWVEYDLCNQCIRYT